MTANSMVIEAAGWLVLANLSLRILPFRRLATHLGDPTRESAATVDDGQRAIAVLVAQAVQAARHHLPFESACLARAIAAMAMLQRRRQDCTLYLGLSKTGEEELGAHAWLRTGDMIVTGGEQRDGHVVVGRFMKSAAIDTERN